MNDSFAEPLDLDDEHEVIRWVDQERDESFVMSAEMQRAQELGWVGRLAGMMLILDRIDEYYSMHEGRQWRAQGCPWILSTPGQTKIVQRATALGVRVIGSGAQCGHWAPEPIDHDPTPARARVRAMFSRPDVHELQLPLAPPGACAQGWATSQLVSTGQPVAVSQGLEPPLAAR